MLGRTIACVEVTRFAYRGANIFGLWVTCAVGLHNPVMWFFYLASIPLLVAAVVYGLRYMPSRRSSWAVKLDVGLAWFSALSVLVLVPTDVASTLQGSSPKLLATWWRLAYWYGFAVQFTVLPFHQEYADSGHFTVGDRIRTAIRNNLIFYAVLVALAIGGLLLLLMTGNLAPSNVLGFCVAASNAFGLIAGIFLMGYGLVAIPKELWRTADTKHYRKLLFHRAGVQADKAMAAHSEMSQVVALVHKVKGTFRRTDPCVKYMDRIVTTADSHAAETQPALVELDDDVDLDFFDRQDLGVLNRRLRKGIENYEREKALYDGIVLEYLELEDIVRNQNNPGGPFESTLHTAPPKALAYLEWWWKCALRGPVLRLLSVLLAGFSVCIVLAEATISGALPNLSVFSRVLHRTAHMQFATELLTFLFLCYPCLCAYYAIYKLGRFNFYLLVPGHTTPYSLLANGLLMCRFAAPLAFNFMAAIAIPPSSRHAEGDRDVQDTAFYAEFGELMMRQPLIGLDFQSYLPIAILPYMLLLAFNVFNRFAGLFTRSRLVEFEDDWETVSPSAGLGTRLLRQELHNHTQGLPPGLTAMPSSNTGERAGQGLDAELMPPEQPSSTRWWNRLPGRGGDLKGQGGSQGDLQHGEAPLSAAQQARDRLARVAGRSSGAGLSSTEGSASTALLNRDDVSVGPSEDEESALLPGQSQSRRTTNGSLDSIFERMEAQPTESQRPRPGPSLRIASDDGESGSSRKPWWRR
ncbi:hypothetical protein ABBQ38_014857 [Trebouxia sp. C0009 RCD-2024]